MSSPRYDAGRERLNEIFGPHGEQALARLNPVAPDLARQVIEHAYGDVYSTETLSYRDRSLATIAGLTTLGHAQSQLASHIRGGLNSGLARAEIVEVITQMALYAGYPAAINAALTAKQVFDDLDKQTQESA